MSDTPQQRSGCVYRIWSPMSPNCYIGSTFKNPKIRFAQHVKAYLKKTKQSSVSTIFDQAGPYNCIITVLNRFDCSKDDLRRWEQYYINIHPNAINKNRAIKPPRFEIAKDSPERFISHMFYQNGDNDVSVPLSMIDKHAYYLTKRDGIISKLKARSDHCETCGRNYNQLKIHEISDKHKKRAAQLALSPIMAKHTENA